MRMRRYPRALVGSVFVALLGGCPPAETPAPVAPSSPSPPAAAPGPSAAARGPAPPATDKRPVTDTHHGVAVTDDYRWLEQGTDPAVQAWSRAQNGHARVVLDALPAADAVRARLRAILGAEAPSFEDVSVAAGKVFALKVEPPKQQPMLVVLDGVMSSAAKVIVDPSALDAAGTTSIDWYKPSPDGKLVAVSLSKGGTEAGDLHFYDVATGNAVHEVIPGVNGGTAGGTMAWGFDGKGVFYSRYPRPGERAAEDMSFYVQAYYHRFGDDPAKDRYEIGKDFPRIAELELIAHPPTGQLLLTVQNGDGGEFAHYLRGRDGRWRQFSAFGDRVIQAAFGPRNDLYLLSRADAPRGKVLRIPTRTLDVAAATVVVPESDATLVDSFWHAPSIVATPRRLYLQVQLGGPSEIRVYDHDGKRQPGPKGPEVSGVGGIIALTGDDVLYASKSFIEPPAYLRYDAAKQSTEKTALAGEAPVDMTRFTVRREMATSKDGTKIPVNIILPSAAPEDGSMPCVVNGYGGYGVSLSPRYRPQYAVLLEQGVCYAVANLRGGGEYGEQWHRQGNLTKKQNVFDDFEAVLRHLVAQKYTSSDRLAIIGGSNGGLLMGATMTQHPELTTAVVSFVGIYDMLRVELSPNGAFNVTEFGTVKNADHFRAMYAYSPYHRVVDETPYPATLMLTGENDPRVDPMQSRKMVARLQAATASAEPILLRTSADSGHGGSNSLEERIAQLTDAYAFLFAQLGVTYRSQ
ncbi:MAG: prolyl oligopeptidase family serine peptidase [Myxococcota bacterium]